LLRAEGAPLGRLRPWAPSPAWPEGRGVFLLRPLLDVRRATLRGWLAEQGLPWIEDPANADRRFGRARVRSEAADLPDPPAAEPQPRSPLLEAAEVTADGRITLPRAALLGSADARRFTAAALACASGRTGAVRSDRIEALLGRLRSPASSTATLGGARVEGTSDQVAFGREPGRGGLADVALTGRPVIWDGRFEFDLPGVEGRLTALRGLTSHLPREQRRALAVVPVSARGVLPARVALDGAVSSPVLELQSDGSVRPLVADRLQAALGGVVREP
jgi:tRNA(Ile)-lysidine synthase